MSLGALLLSEDAEADQKPELEIFADDVQCAHGATSGAIDAQLLFYLLARGIPRKQAEALLVQAFFGAALEQIPTEGVREALIRPPGASSPPSSQSSPPISSASRQLGRRPAVPQARRSPRRYTAASTARR
jgi:hypothetical protein